MTAAPQAAKDATQDDLVTVSIDGIEISVPKGTLLIRAAEQLGISIPRFCDHPLLDPAGACRPFGGAGSPKPRPSGRRRQVCRWRPKCVRWQNRFRWRSKVRSATGTM